MRLGGKGIGPKVAASLMGAVVVLLALPASAGCTWKFDWYCSDCAKIGGRTTGTQGGYGSESACESARSSVRSPVTSMSCDRVGWCDEPRRQASPPPSDSGRGSGYTGGGSPQPDYTYQLRLEEQDRQAEEARRKAVEERKARERAAFEKSKADLLGSLKGSNLDQGVGLKGTGGNDTLKLKSSTPTFGIKSNPGGILKLKDAPAPKFKNPEAASVDPAFFTRPKPTLKIRHVPNPLKDRPDDLLPYVTASKADYIRQAYRQGETDIDQVISNLDRLMTEHGIKDPNLTAAISYLEGVRSSYMAVKVMISDRQPSPVKKPLTIKQWVHLQAIMTAEATTSPSPIDSKHLEDAIKNVSGEQKWPGPVNENRQPNSRDWRVQRTRAMLQAMAESFGDLEKAYAKLKAARDVQTAQNAEYYTRGVYAFWDLLGNRNQK